MLAVGALLLLPAGNDMPPVRWAIVVGAVGLSLLPPFTRILGWLLDRVHDPSRNAADWATVLAGVAATAYLIFTAFNQERHLSVLAQDDCSYVIGTQMMARGRLWMPRHELADFFESFYVFTEPVYC